MPKQKHEDLLIAGIKTLREQGFRVIRLDRRRIPDAIAIYGNKVVAVEADTNPTKVWLTKKKFEAGSQYDEEIIITKPYEQHYHTSKTYYRVLELYKKGDMSLREIVKTVKQEFGLKTLSVSIVHDWVTGRKIPPTVRKPE